MKKSVQSLAYAAACGLLFLCGFVARDLRYGNTPDLSKLKQEAKAPSSTELFESEYKRIINRYYQSVDEESLLYAGLQGMLGSLGDPHTQFLEPIIAKEFEDTSMGRTSFGGVGARLMGDPMGVKVIQVFRGGPADQAGIKNGDIVVGVNGENVGGQTSDAIVEKIKGELGTKVNLEVFRGGSQRVKYTIQRGRIVPPSADWNVIPNTKFGYLLVTGFEAPTPMQFTRSIADLEKEGIKGLVIDLRNNGGGLLDAAKDMLSLFFDYKTVVTMEARNGMSESVLTDGGRAREFKYPIVILQNEQSASAAEIFAGVMRDYGQATIVGEHSYGKASVQNVIRVSGGGSVKLTIASYKLPSGIDMSRKVDDDGRYVSGGLQPDVKVDLDFGPRVAFGDIETDNQLQKAVEILKSKQP